MIKVWVFVLGFSLPLFFFSKFHPVPSLLHEGMVPFSWLCATADLEWLAASDLRPAVCTKPENTAAEGCLCSRSSTKADVIKFLSYLFGSQETSIFITNNNNQSQKPSHLSDSFIQAVSSKWAQRKCSLSLEAACEGHWEGVTAE